MSRLSRGREQLRQRLNRRGLAPAAGLLSASLSADAANAAVPPALAHSLVQAAMQVTANSVTAVGVTATVAALTEGVLKMMVRSRFKGIVGAVLAVAALATGMGVFVYRTAGAWPQDAPATKAATAAPSAPPREDPVRTAKESAAELVVRAVDLARKRGEEPFRGIVAIDPVTAKWRTIYTGLGVGPGPVVSSEGRYLVSAIVGQIGDPQAAGIWVYDLTGETPPRRIF